MGPAFIFFMTQVLGILLEDTVQAVYRSRNGQKGTESKEASYRHNGSVCFMLDDKGQRAIGKISHPPLLYLASISSSSSHSFTLVLAQ